MHVYLIASSIALLYFLGVILVCTSLRFDVCVMDLHQESEQGPCGSA